MIIMVVVTSSRLGSLSNDIANNSGHVYQPSSESILIKGEDGHHMPKKAYWVELLPNTNPDRIIVANGDNTMDTDGNDFHTDVDLFKTQYIYDPNKRFIFRVMRKNGDLTLIPETQKEGIKFMHTPLNEPIRMTIIGMPQAPSGAMAPKN